MISLLRCECEPLYSPFAKASRTRRGDQALETYCSNVESFKAFYQHTGFRCRMLSMLKKFNEISRSKSI